MNDATEQDRSERNAAQFRRIVEEVWSGDFSGYDDVFAADVVVHTPMGTFEGRDAYRAYVAESLAVVPDFRADLHDSWSAGDRVAGRFTQQGTQTKAAPRLLLPATRRSFEIPGANFAHFEDGRCAEMWTIWDKTEFLRQLAAYPGLPAAYVRSVAAGVRTRLRGR